MKRYCKNVDITDRKLIQKAVHKCLRNKYKRNDVLEMFSEYSGLPKDFIKGAFEEFGIKALRPVSYTHLDVYKRQMVFG